MLHPVTVRFLLLAACGWLPAAPAAALTLGRAHGAALLGRPLEVTVPVTVDTPTGEPPCASADVFYGERQVAPSVRLEPAGPGLGTVRVQSSEPVDEPMVTVYLKVGCNQASARRYVLLSELPPRDEPVERAVAAVPPVTAAASSPLAAVTRPQARAPARHTGRRAATPRARLKLEPLDLDLDRDPILRITSQLAPPAAAGAQQRQAFAALWQALQRSPEQAVEDAARLQAMQRDLDSVRGAIRDNAVAIAELRAQAERDRKERNVASALVAGLAVVLFVLLAVLGWRWYRERQLQKVGRWFELHGDTVQPRVPTLPAAPKPVAAKAPARAVPPDAVPPTVTNVVSPVASRKSAAAPSPSRGFASGWGGLFRTSRSGALRTVGVQELVDVHDKADFFLSIGETEQAVRVLETHVHDQVETGALAWLDLLELYHALGRRPQFDRLRATFRQRFAAQVPDFDQFGQATGTLDAYDRALDRIVALWPSPKVLEVIDESIFRKEGKAGGEPFSLAAYRELVLLRHIARDMNPDLQAETRGANSTFADTAVEALNATGRPTEAPLTERERLMIPPASARLGVDIDLGDPQAGPSGLQPLDFDMSSFDPASADGGDTRP